MIKKHDEKSFEFYGLHKIQKKEDKEKALKIANDRKSHFYSILKHLEEDKPIKEVFEENKNLIEKMDYLWISTLFIYNGYIMVLSAGISSIRDGHKLVGTAIDYLKSETDLKTLGIKEPNS
jgi:hypothetical protein